MACCAFVAFLIAQAYLFVDAVRARLGIKGTDRDESEVMSVDWRLAPAPLGDSPALGARSTVRSRSRFKSVSNGIISIFAIFALSFALTSVIAQPHGAYSAFRSALLNPAAWCSGFSKRAGN